MFYDLNISWKPNDPELPRTLAFLHELGYNVVALSHTISGKLPADLTCPIPDPLPIPTPPRLHILRRCTLLLTEPASTPRLSQLAAQYDILAVRPTDEKTLQQACTTLDCDLISLDLSQRLGFILRHRTLAAALQRNVRFELCYAAGLTPFSSSSSSFPAVNASTTNDTAALRRNLISNATSLIRASRGRGIVVSSGAGRAAGCRAPWDVVNLLAVWGLGPERGKEAVANGARTVVVTARLKRTGYRGAVDVLEGGERPNGKAEGGGGTVKSGSGGGGGGNTTRKRGAGAVSTTTAEEGDGQLSKREMKRRAKRAKVEGQTN